MQNIRATWHSPGHIHTHEQKQETTTSATHQHHQQINSDIYYVHINSNSTTTSNMSSSSTQKRHQISQHHQQRDNNITNASNDIKYACAADPSAPATARSSVNNQDDQCTTRSGRRVRFPDRLQIGISWQSTRVLNIVYENATKTLRKYTQASKN